MKKSIYISGKITNPATGQPRDGWQRDFLKVEAKLRGMGFNVINPIDIAQEVDDAFKWRFGHFGGPMNGFGEPCSPTRTDYIMACLQRMKMAHEADCLHAVYVIGDADACNKSHGVQMELHMTKLLEIPVFSEYRKGNEIWTDNFHVKANRTIEAFAKEE